LATRNDYQELLQGPADFSLQHFARAVVEKSGAFTVRVRILHSLKSDESTWKTAATIDITSAIWPACLTAADPAVPDGALPGALFIEKVRLRR
jgi:hypothetical protein